MSKKTSEIITDRDIAMMMKEDQNLSNLNINEVVYLVRLYQEKMQKCLLDRKSVMTKLGKISLKRRNTNNTLANNIGFTFKVNVDIDQGLKQDAIDLLGGLE